MRLHHPLESYANGIVFQNFNSRDPLRRQGGLCPPEVPGQSNYENSQTLKASFFSFLFIFLLLIGNKKFLFGFVSRVIQFCDIFKRMEISSGAIGSCSKDQKTMYQEWFQYADSGHYNLFLPLFSSPSLFLLLSMIIIIIIFFFKDGDGRITGNDATKFFSLSKLSRQDLKPVRSFIS